MISSFHDWQSQRPFCVRSVLFSALCIAFSLTFAAPPAAAQNSFSDQDLYDAFFRTVFGLEYQSFGRGAGVVKKFTGPVRVYIDSRSSVDRRPAVRSFIRSVNRSVRHLDLRATDRPQRANFTVFIVDRAQYAQVIQDDVYNSSRAPVRGRCMVRIITGSEGIRRAQAVIVSDEGEFLFNRCMVEEILQGLGPLNDDSSLVHSVFNDNSRHARFMAHDRYLLNMLYHPSIRPGMNRNDVRGLLPPVLRDVRGHLG